MPIIHKSFQLIFANLDVLVSFLIEKFFLIAKKSHTTPPITFDKDVD